MFVRKQGGRSQEVRLDAAIPRVVIDERSQAPPKRKEFQT